MGYRLQQEIREALHAPSHVDTIEGIEERILFIKEYMQKSGVNTAVLGISGGQDSTLAGKLTQLAIEELREETGEGTYQFFALRLPYGTQNDMGDVDKVMEFIQPDHDITINIKEAVDSTVDALAEAGIMVNDYHKGNIKARQRMIVQYAVAGVTNGIVVGTDHAAEAVTGFFTKYGDGAADIMPLHPLNKRQGWKMLNYFDLDWELLQKAPTTDLEGDKPMIADEKVLGVDYNTIDSYLEGNPIDPESQKIIEELYLKSKHKRNLPVRPFDEF